MRPSIGGEKNPCFINSLPDDVFVEIFTLLYELWFTGSTHHQRAEYRVCRKWQNIMLSCRLLWRKIFLPATPRYDNGLNTLSFVRIGSSSSLIDIHIYADMADPERRIQTCLTQYASRIRYIKIESRDHADIPRIFRHFKCRTTNLTSMALFSSRIWDMPTFSGQVMQRRLQTIKEWPGMSALTSLYLYGCSVFQFPESSHISCLHLENVNVTQDGLTDILAQFPSLNTLVIDGMRATPEYFSGPPIPAPSLRRLVLGSCEMHDPTSCSCGFGVLDAPNLEQLEIRCTSYLLTDMHLSYILKEGHCPKLGKVRLAVANLWRYNDIPFLRSLPASIPLYLDLPHIKSSENDQLALFDLLESTNFHSINLTIHRHPPQTAKESMDGEKYDILKNLIDEDTFIQMIRTRRPKLGSPLYLKGLEPDLLPTDVRDVIGSNLLTSSSPPEWFIASWDSNIYFDPCYDLLTGVGLEEEDDEEAIPYGDCYLCEVAGLL